MRADAVRNRNRILDATIECLSCNPDASMAALAAAAGLGRMTLYGHFATREQLLTEALAKALADGEGELEKIDLTGPADDALQRLIESSWKLVDRSRALLSLAQTALPSGEVRELHEAPRKRVEELIERGQRDGAFRTDLPAQWLSGVLHSVINGAAEEIAVGRLAPDDAAPFISATVLAAFRA